MVFDLSSRGQWDDFRVWFSAGSDVCFVRLVYLMIRAQVPPGEGNHMFVLFVFRAIVVLLTRVEPECFSGSENVFSPPIAPLCWPPDGAPGGVSLLI